jgi:hypothetical protein
VDDRKHSCRPSACTTPDDCESAWSCPTRQKTDSARCF